MRRVFGIRPLIPSECNELVSSSHARWLFSARRARSIIVHFRLASFSIRALVSGTWAEQCVTSQRKSTHAARGTKITCIETHGPVTRFSFTSVEHRRFTWLCVTGGERSRSLSLRHLRAEKRGLGRSCSHERNSSRQVNLPRGSFDPPPSVHGGATKEENQHCYPHSKSCHVSRFAFRLCDERSPRVALASKVRVGTLKNVSSWTIAKVFAMIKFLRGKVSTAGNSL